MLLGQIATLAQSVERLTRNEKVDSSILSSGSLAHSGASMLLVCAYALGWFFQVDARVAEW